MTQVLKASTDIIINIPALPIELTAILAIMSVSTFKTAVILYISWFSNILPQQDLLIS